MKLAHVIAVLVLMLTACAGAKDSGEGQSPSKPRESRGTSSPLSSGKSSPPTLKTDATTAQVLAAVKAATNLQTLPPAAMQALKNAAYSGPKEKSPEFADARNGFNCRPKPQSPPSTRFGACAYGDQSPNAKLMVIFGDSHATMWAAALEGVAAKNGYRLRVFSLGGCPAPDLDYAKQDGGVYPECQEFRAGAYSTIQELRPNLVVATSVQGRLADGKPPRGDQLRDGWVSTLKKFAGPDTRTAIIGALPFWPDSDSRCLAAHVDNVQRCSAPLADAEQRTAEEAAAAKIVGSLFIPTSPWICAEQCEPVIDEQIVFQDPSHLTQTYATYLTGALDEALKPVLAAS